MPYMTQINKTEINFGLKKGNNETSCCIPKNALPGCSKPQIIYQYHPYSKIKMFRHLHRRNKKLIDYKILNL